MDRIRIWPTKLSGTVRAPSSKSMGHREIICAGLARGESLVDNISMSKDIEATVGLLRAMGAVVTEASGASSGRAAFKIAGTGKPYAASSFADCGESGSTLRFFVPLGALLGKPFTFIGHGKLVTRPLDAYYRIFEEQGLSYSAEGGRLPLTVEGRLRPGAFALPGDVSSQYVSGLLFALPLLEEDSVIEITSPLESASYVDMTVACLEKYGVTVKDENGDHRRYLVPGGQEYRARASSVEGDWSQAAFWAVGGAMGARVSCSGCDAASLQGDRKIAAILRRMGADIEEGRDYVTVSASATEGTLIDASDCPDIIPVLTALAAVSWGTTRIVNAGRLRIKECDRLSAITSELNKLGALIMEGRDNLTVIGKPEGLRGGAEVDAWGDHRIAMSLAIAAQRCEEPVCLTGAESVAKSYPLFWQDYAALGGKVEVLS